MNKLEKAVQMGLGTLVMFCGGEVGLSLLEGHWASLPQVVGLVILGLVLYAVLPQGK